MRALSWTLMTIVLIVSGCKLNTDYFSDYRGANILGKDNFTGGSPGWALVPTTAGSVVPMSRYMNWEQISSGETASDWTLDQAATTPQVGPDGTSPVFRLEIKNLFPNGDFEDTTTDTSWQTLLAAGSSNSIWSVSATPISLTVPAGSPFSGFATSPSVTGNWLEWNSNPGDTLSLNLLAAQESSISLATWDFPNKHYVFRFDFYNGSTAPATIPIVQTNGTTQVSDWKQTNLGASTLYSLANEFSPSAGGEADTVLVGGASTSTVILIDHIRLLPSFDQSLAVQTVFSSLSSGSLTLLPGSKAGDYVLTLYVRDDPTAGSNNRFQAQDLTAKVTSAVNSGSPTFQQTVARIWSASGWTKLTFSMGFDFVTTNPTDGSAVLTIQFFPTAGIDGSTGLPDAGSLLISEPVLTFNP